jgi:hypothetical protein
MTINAIGVLRLSAAGLIISAFVFGGVSAAEKKKEPAMPKPPACRTIKAEADCTAREDCTWRDAVINKKTGKETRRASCAAKPKPKPSKKKADPKM